MSHAPLLLVAYQCGPGQGSVAQIGWHWFTGMAARGPTTLVTHVRHRAAIESAPDRPAGARIIYIDTEWFAAPLYRLARRLFPRSEHGVFLVSQLDWFVFDAVALRRLRRERAAGAPWQLLHLLTPVTLSAPTRLHRLGLPMLRGPLNCGLPTPPGFAELLGAEALGLGRLRWLPAMLDRLSGGLRHTAVLLVATQATRAAVPRLLRERCVSMLENAVDTRCFHPPASEPPTSNKLRLAFVGRLVAVKALPLLLRAMATLRAEGRELHLDIAGSGPMEDDWREQAHTLGLSGCLRWHGALDVQGVAELMRSCDVFCLPSVRESGGAVLLEAMACGRPVLAMDFGGPAEIVDDTVGWRIAMPDPQRAVLGIAQALREAQDEPQARRERGQRALDRVLSEHVWNSRFEAAQALYARLHPPPEKPRFAVVPQLPPDPRI